jgi:hypothetical protein
MQAHHVVAGLPVERSEVPTHQQAAVGQWQQAADAVIGPRAGIEREVRHAAPEGCRTGRIPFAATAGTAEQKTHGRRGYANANEQKHYK